MKRDSPFLYAIKIGLHIHPFFDRPDLRYVPRVIVGRFEDKRFVL